MAYNRKHKVTSTCLGLALFLSGSAGSASAATTEPKTKEALQHAVTEYRSGFRHSDGVLACERMTIQQRRHVLGALVSVAPEMAGVGCVGVVNVYGRTIYASWMGGRQPMTHVRFTGSCAQYRRGTSRFRMRRVDGHWRTDVGTRCGR